MNNEKWTRGAAVFGSSYIKRWLEGKYDQLADLPAVAKLKAVSSGTKLGIEAILYTLAAYAEQSLTDQSPLGLMAKTVLMDAAPEIASRLMTDVRAELTSAASGAQSVDGPQQSVSRKLLALQNKELLGILISVENMDDADHDKFVSFAADATADELAKFSTLSTEQRRALLGVHGSGRNPSDGGWAESFKSFASDFGLVFKAWSKKSHEVAIPVLNRYMLALLWVIKTSAILWAVAFVVATASVICSRWILFALYLGMVGASALAVGWGKRCQRSWVVAASMVSAAVIAVLALLTASGYADSIFGVAVLFLVGVPTLTIITLLIPATMALEILRSLFPDGHKTLVRAAQMLLSAFFGVLFLSVVLLVFPPQNPIAFLFVVPITIIMALGVGFGLMRTNPAMFLRAPVILVLGCVFFVAVGMMSMPNLRTKLRSMAGTVDRNLVAAPKPVDFASSKAIDFVTVNGDVKIWYAERSEGGYDLYRCEGVGPYYAQDGRRLIKADNDAIRQKIGKWVDYVAMKRIEMQRKTDQERAAREAEEHEAQIKRTAEANAKAEKQREEREKMKMEQRAIELEQQKEEAARVEKTRRDSYLISTTLPSKVNYIICAVSATGRPMEEFASQLAKQIQGDGKPSSNAVFSPAFITEGGFDLFYEGKGGLDIKAMPLGEMGSKILLVRCGELNTKASETVPGLVTTTVKMGFRILSAADGSVLDDFHLTGIGPGTGDKDAEANALARILEQVGQHKFE